MPQTLHSFTLNLLTDPQAMSAFQLDPATALAQAGLADITPQDVQEVIPLVMDSAAVGSLQAGAGGVSGGFGTESPFGDMAAVGDLDMSAGSPTSSLGLWSDQGDLGVATDPSGFTLHGTGSFTAAGDLGNSLDADALDGMSGAGASGVTEGSDFLTRTLADGAVTTGGMLTTGAGALASDLTPGASSAASLLIAGASSMAGLLGTGSGLTAGLMADPAGTVESTVDTATAATHGLPDAGQLPVDVPNLTDLPADPTGGLPQLPAAPGLPLPAVPGLPALPQLSLPPLQLPTLPQLPVQLPVQLPGLSAVQPVGASADATATSHVGAEDVSQSPLGGVTDLAPQHGVTDLLHDVTSLDGHLPLF